MMHGTDRIITLGLAMTMMVFLLACTFGGSSVGGQTELPQTDQSPIELSPDTPTPASLAKDYEVGDVIEIGDWSMIVVGWDQPAATDYTAPEGGNQWVRINLAQVNASSEARAAGNGFSLKDNQGTIYETNINVPPLDDQSTLGGNLHPGERMLGSIGFEVPEDAAGFQLVFDPLTSGEGDVAVISLGDEPAKVSIPDDIVGEKQLDTYPHGQPVDFEGLELTIQEITYPSGTTISPHADHQFIALHVSVKNTTSSQITLDLTNTFLMFKLRTPNGARILPSIGYNTILKLNKLEGQVDSGNSVDGYVIAEIPQDLKGLILVFDPKLQEAGTALISLDN